VLIFHQAALGDFIVTWPIAVALGRIFAQSRVSYITAAGKGQLAGRVIGVDMTPSMHERALESADALGAMNVDFELGYAERLPIPDAWADVVISNGVMNLFPDKVAGLQEMARIYDQQVSS